MANLRFSEFDYFVLHWALSLYLQYINLPEAQQPIRLPEMTDYQRSENAAKAYQLLDRAQKAWLRQSGLT